MCCDERDIHLLGKGLMVGFLGFFQDTPAEELWDLWRDCKRILHIVLQGFFFFGVGSRISMTMYYIHNHALSVYVAL